jgi:hypothetical protein
LHESEQLKSALSILSILSHRKILQWSLSLHGILASCAGGVLASSSADKASRLQRLALRGLALAAAAHGDAEAAEQLLLLLLGAHGPQKLQKPQPAANPLAAFEHILGLAAPKAEALAPQAAAAPGPEVEHWAHGDYGWLLFARGDYQV